MLPNPRMQPTGRPGRGSWRARGSLWPRSGSNDLCGRGPRGLQLMRISLGCAEHLSFSGRETYPITGDTTPLLTDWQKELVKMTKNTICLWYEHDAEEAARFYAETFPQSSLGAVHRAPADYPDGKAGAFSFQIATDDQEETDRYWNAIVGNGGQESQCGWCKDKWGVSWQITPRVLTDALAKGGDAAKRAFDAMMPMKKIDVAAIEAAVRGSST